MNLGLPGARHVTPARAAIAGGTAVAAAVAVTLSLTLTHGTTAAARPAAKPATARLSASSCTGPAGAAYIALPGYQAFDAVNSANCALIQQYNVGDPPVPGTGTSDTNYSSTNEGVAMYGKTLYFADTGNDTVAVLDSSALQVSNYENPAETLIPVGINPDSVAVTPDGSQVWVADTGPQTGLPSLGDIKAISTSSDKVTSTLKLLTDPRQIAFSPSGATAYVTSSVGVYVINTAAVKVTRLIPGLGDPEGVTVSPDGKTVYVTNTAQGVVDVVSAANDRVTKTIKVGQLPWQMVLSSSGGTLYVADGDSNQVSVIATASDTVTSTISVAGDPVAVALTPDGSELWVGGLTSGIVSVFNTSDDSLAGSFNVGYGGYPNSGDGDEPTGIVLTSTPTPGS
jgi:phospholipase C